MNYVLNISMAAGTVKFSGELLIVKACIEALQRVCPCREFLHCTVLWLRRELMSSAHVLHDCRFATQRHLLLLILTSPAKSSRDANQGA
jgi:hypothetical protein